MNKWSQWRPVSHIGADLWKPSKSKTVAHYNQSQHRNMCCDCLLWATDSFKSPWQSFWEKHIFFWHFYQRFFFCRQIVQPVVGCKSKGKYKNALLKCLFLSAIFPHFGCVFCSVGLFPNTACCMWVWHFFGQFV